MLQLPARFTPPLTEDFITDGDRLIELMELCWVTPESDAPIELDEWQKWLLRHILNATRPTTPITLANCATVKS